MRSPLKVGNSLEGREVFSGAEQSNLQAHFEHSMHLVVQVEDQVGKWVAPFCDS